MDNFLAWFKKVEKVKFLGIEERALTFKAKKAFKVGSRPTIEISIPIAEGGSEDFRLPVTIIKVRDVGDGFVVCTGMVPGAAQSVEQLRQILTGVDPSAVQPAEVDDGDNMRRARRFTWSIRVLSKELPGFRALSIDLNRLGVKLATEGPAEVGRVISLVLEIETARTPEVLCQGIVRWSKEVTRRKYEVGIEFTALHPDVVRELERFEHFLEDRMCEEIAIRQAKDSKVFENESFGPGVGTNDEDPMASVAP